MPTYQYECEACGHGFELFQSMTEAKKRKCPKCGRLKLVRLLGLGAGVIFKGSGFYETDYKRSNRSSKKDENKESRQKSADSSCCQGECAAAKN